MDFVVNEWLPEYFRPKAKEDEKQKLERFLNKFYSNNDRIFVRRPSEFLSKIDKYAKNYQRNRDVCNRIRDFIKKILKDTDKCCIIDNEDFRISEEIVSKLEQGGNKISDKYLFEAASETESKIIVTSDVKLIDYLKNDKVYKVISLDEFLESYK